VTAYTRHCPKLEINVQGVLLRIALGLSAPGPPGATRDDPVPFARRRPARDRRDIRFLATPFARVRCFRLGGGLVGGIDVYAIMQRQATHLFAPA
jgi:hypothetical protein